MIEVRLAVMYRSRAMKQVMFAPLDTFSVDIVTWQRLDRQIIEKALSDNHKSSIDEFI